MTVEAIRLQNFMAFEDTQWVELRPITMLFGRNSTGKSAIIRALLLLKQSLASCETGIPFLFDHLYGIDLGDFRDVVHNGYTHRNIWFHFRCSSPEIQDALERHGFADHRTRSEATLEIALGYAAHRGVESEVDLSRIELADLQIRLGVDDRREDVPLFQAVLLDPEDSDLYGEDWYVQGVLTQSEQSANWAGFRCDLVQNFLDIKFTQPQPDVPGGYQCLDDLFRILKDEIAQFLHNIAHLGPIRPEPKRRYSFDRTAAFEWRARGWTAFLDFISGKPSRTKMDEINQWLCRLELAASAEPRRVSEIEALVAEYEIGIAEAGQPTSRPLNLMGFGTSQVLPVIVQSVLAVPGSLVIVEQPELHLHPRAQAVLGDLVVMAAQKGISCLIETHSEHLLLRLRYRIADTTLDILKYEQGKRPGGQSIEEREKLEFELTTSSLAVYFTERFSSTSTVKPILIDNRGQYGSMPEGFSRFFSEDFEQVMKINLAIAKMNELDGGHAPNN